MKLYLFKNRLLLLAFAPFLSLAFFTGNETLSHIAIQTDDDDSLKNNTFPALMVQDDKGVSHPFLLQQLKVDVVVIGNIATTTMDMTFYNSENRILEGELYFPLGEGQTVSRFALDIEGKLREGVIVEKDKGRQVFESVIRQNIDPGLLEWTQGNNFKARVYPIPAKGQKRMVLAFEQELELMEQSYVYQLPMNFEREIPDFQFHLAAINAPVSPESHPDSPIQLNFEKQEADYYASYVKKDYQPGRAIQIGLPWPQNKQALFTERVPGTENDFYYYLTLEPDPVISEVTKPNSISLIWDASNSTSKRDLSRELALLESYFEFLGNAHVDLFCLRNTLDKVQGFEVSGGKCTGLIDRIKILKNDGASAYRAIEYSHLPGEAILLLGDGLNNFDVSKESLPKIPLFAINSSSSANHSYLNFLASASGGAYINLMKTEHRTALMMMKGSAMRYLGNGQTDTYPSKPTVMRDRIQVVGIIHGTTELDFDFGIDGNNSREHVRIEPEKHLSATGMLRRIWAQKKLAELDIYPEENSEAITALGKEFGLVTRNTSLIVLDRLEDYLTHEIVPPQEMQKEYFAQIEDRKEEKERLEKEHLTTVKENFKQYVAWWNTEFDSNIEKITQADSLVIGVDRLQLEVVGNASSYSDVSVADGTTMDIQEEASFDRFSASEAEKKTEEKESKSSIQIAAWEPDAAYLKELKKVSVSERYERYLELKKEHGNSPSFYLDVSDLFLADKDEKTALRILSNIAELELENHEILRILAHRLEQLKYYDLAAEVFETVLRMRNEEPQSYRDLGLCLDKKGEGQRAIEMLYHVATHQWDTRFPDIEGIALIEMNRIISTYKGQLDFTGIDRDFIQDLPLDVRIILTWDTDNCDMDLWVTDPLDEKCFYSNKETRLGGRMSNDFTGGYGPEMFTLKKAKKGNYVVQINYYGSRSQKASGPTTIQMKLITNYGRANEHIEEITRRLSETQEVLDIGTLLFE